VSERSEGDEDRCLVCLNKMEVFSVGECNHPICHICTTRMRVLCQRNECAICRRDLPKVIFTSAESKFELIKDNIYPMDRKFKICFETEEIQNQYFAMLDHKCPKCKEDFKTFRQLDQHIRREHETYYCELCVKNLNLFTHERKTYSRELLVRHRRKGDEGDSSMKGHPNCEYCDNRYFDNEELYKHLRKDHYFCHFCDADGLQAFYADYQNLRGHFARDHHLCEEPDCEEKKFVVFRTEIDLKGHRLAQHSGALSKAGSKEARKVELDFQFSRREPQGREERRGGRGHGRSATPEVAYHDQLDGPPREASGPAPDLQADFPSLFAAAPSSSSSGRSGELARRVAHSAGHNTQAGWSNKTAPLSEDFPSLPGAPAPVAPVAPTSYGPRAPAQSTRPATAQQVEAFPGLGPPSRPAAPASWVKASQANKPTPRTSKVAPAPVLPTSGSNKKGQAKQSKGVSKSSSGPRLVDMRVGDSDDDDFPPPPQPDLALSHFSRLTVRQSGQDLGYSSREGQASNITTVDRAAFEAAQAAAGGASGASASKKVPLQGEDFPGLGPSEKKLDFITSGGGKKKGKKKGGSSVMNNGNSSNGSNHNNNGGVKTSQTMAPASLSSICDFLGGSDKKEEKQTRQAVQNPTAKDVQGTKDNVKAKKEKEEVKPIHGKGKAMPGSAEEVFRPSKVKKLVQGEDMKENKPLPTDPTMVEDFPSLGGPTRGALSANFVKAEDKLFKQKTVPSQWSQNNDSTSKKTDSESKEASNGATNSSVSQDFPVLKSKKPPPGFGKNSQKSSKPPPGFKNMPSNHKYTPPTNFQERNSALITTITGLIGGKSLEFKTFKDISGQFRRGQLTPDAYFSQCRGLVSKGHFDTFFPELLVLLPDIGMQGELLGLYLQHGGEAAASLQQCGTCAQVCLVGGESEGHATTHNMDQDFPRL